MASRGGRTLPKRNGGKARTNLDDLQFLKLTRIIFLLVSEHNNKRPVLRVSHDDGGKSVYEAAVDIQLAPEEFF